MEHTINCFNLQNQGSDYIDGNLPESLKNAADQHLAECKTCKEKFLHYQEIINTLSSQKKSTLPTELRKHPLSAVLPRINASKISLSHWEKIPWYLRVTIETVGIILVVLVGITSAPQLRKWYERSVEHAMTDFKDDVTVTEPINDLAGNNLPGLQTKSTPPQNEIDAQDELSGEDDPNSSDDVKVGKSQLWRFTLKTVSPDELRPQVVKTLTELKIPTNTPGLGGMQVPGGIEFKLILPKESVLDIKHALQKLVPKSENTGPSTSESENFTWYMVKSKLKVPEGKSLVVIWLSQPI